MKHREIRGRADSFRYIFNEVWGRLWPHLQQAENEQDVIQAFDDGAQPYRAQFVPSLASLVLQIRHDSDFPKTRNAQVGFMADSLAGLGQIAPRTSRDICQDERIREKNVHHILRYEFYVECSCGYKGRSLDHACRKCRAEIIFPVSEFADY
jgi:hypothetical protein